MASFIFFVFKFHFLGAPLVTKVCFFDIAFINLKKYPKRPISNIQKLFYFWGGKKHFPRKMVRI
jgi:hypothetical protein